MEAAFFAARVPDWDNERCLLMISMVGGCLAEIAVTSWNGAWYTRKDAMGPQTLHLVVGTALDELWCCSRPALSLTFLFCVGSLHGLRTVRHRHLSNHLMHQCDMCGLLRSAVRRCEVQ